MKAAILRWLGYDPAALKAVADENLRLARAVLNLQDTVGNLATEVNDLREFINQKSEDPAPPQRVRKATTWREFANAAKQARGATK